MTTSIEKKVVVIGGGPAGCTAAGTLRRPGCKVHCHSAAFGGKEGAMPGLFGVIEAAQRDLLAKYLTPVWLAPGETLIRQGEKAEKLHIVASGVAEIVAEGLSGPKIVHRTERRYYNTSW